MYDYIHSSPQLQQNINERTGLALALAIALDVFTSLEPKYRVELQKTKNMLPFN